MWLNIDPQRLMLFLILNSVSSILFCFTLPFWIRCYSRVFLVNVHIVSALTSVFFSLSSVSLSSLRRAGIGRGKRSVLKTKVWEPMETSVDGNAGTLEPHAQDVGLMLLWTRAKYHSLFLSSLGGGTANRCWKRYQSLHDAAVSKTDNTNHTRIRRH